MQNMVRNLVRFANFVVRVCNDMIGAHVPLCVWLDNSTLNMYRTRL
jgi:hypothetical protein